MTYPCIIQTAMHALVYPVVNSQTDALVGVLELLRAEAHFQEEDEEIVNSYLVWGEVALHYADLYECVNRQKDLSGFLLTIVK